MLLKGKSQERPKQGKVSNGSSVKYLELVLLAHLNHEFGVEYLVSFNKLITIQSPCSPGIERDIGFI